MNNDFNNLFNNITKNNDLMKLMSEMTATVFEEVTNINSHSDTKNDNLTGSIISETKNEPCEEHINLLNMYFLDDNGNNVCDLLYKINNNLERLIGLIQDKNRSYPNTDVD